MSASLTWRRRARPMLGTLVEVGVAASPQADAAIDAAFAVVAQIEAQLSAFRTDSEVCRFAALPAGGRLQIGADLAAVLAAARELHDASDGLFDITLQRSPAGWHCDGRWLHKHADDVCLELGGIAKGHAVDRAVAALQAAGGAHGWVNAGGDLRAFGAAVLPLELRDEQHGGARRFAALADGAFATSRFAADSRCRAVGRDGRAVHAHASVAAPTCLWADALTKVVAASADARHPLLARYDAQAWLH